MLKGFRDFISRGNVIELAVAVVIGAAFNGVVTAFTDGFLKPLISLTGGIGVDDKQGLQIGSQVLNWPAFVNAVITFILTAATVYFLVVLPMNKLAERRKRGIEPEPEAPSDEIRLLTEIRDLLATGTTQRDQAGPITGPGGVAPGTPVKPTDR
ncbi:large conductance mechanosensitive channel protein MscL [Dactylosporangium matsuzakiense]|uniref:Large-conductance mechanosensitive channel n=1 Tax=Dactylosporangium matsuzakiense TaxID=53360 RepID=A0A9W6KS45_9ACTN|nr:large conductance mechanosensitive channel protein MscL [Dactylosporangium matsuzakiense]UWZ46478.1 large conductance mechanosensitive channel protein MscL [Dactylosporangium matsuzakiense]GLL06608.1 large-conductance mechanosensitive channel [Dactylosporangium matsuzakiense]